MRVLVGCLFGLSVCFSPGAIAAENEPYRIGVVIPLSGTYASLGNYVKNGIDLAYSRLPDDLKRQIRLIYEDDRMESRESVSAFHKLRSTEDIDAVLVISSGVGNAVGPLAEKNKTLMVAIGASDKNFASGTTYVFTHWVSPEEESRVLLDEISRRGYKRLAFLGLEHEGVISVENALLVEAKKRGVDDLFVMVHRELTNVRDFRTAIAKLRSKNVDGVVTLLLPGGLGAFAKQARDLKLDAEVFGFELFEDENEVRASDGALVGKWYVNADDSDSPFATAYKTRYNENPGFAAANGYDTLNLIAQAVKTHGKDNNKIADALRSVEDYQGAAGTYSATGDNRFRLPAAVKVIEEDGFRKLQR